MFQGIATKVLTGEVRLSYVQLLSPATRKPGEQPKYSTALLIPKTDTATIDDIFNSIEAAAVEAQGKKWGGYRPPNIHEVIHDGDGVKNNGKPYSDECKGHWVLTASSLQAPGIVHQSNIQCKLCSDEDVYSGMYARVTLNFYGYNTNNKIGVGCGLGNVMKTRDGERLSGGASAEEDFANVGAVVQSQFNPAVAAGVPASYAPPVAAPQPQAAPAYQQFAQPYQAPVSPPAQPMQGYPHQVTINPLTGQPM